MLAHVTSPSLGLMYAVEKVAAAVPAVVSGDIAVDKCVAMAVAAAVAVAPAAEVVVAIPAVAVFHPLMVH